MIADEVARLVPGGKQLGAISILHAHAASKQRGADIFFGNRFQNAAVGFLPFEDRSEGECRIVEGEGELGPCRIVGRSFWRSALWKKRGAKGGRKKLRAKRGRGAFYGVGEKSAAFHGNDLK